MNDLDIIAIIARRLNGESWGAIAKDYIRDTPTSAPRPYTAQMLRRHVKASLFPTRKKK